MLLEHRHAPPMPSSALSHPSRRMTLTRRPSPAHHVVVVWVDATRHERPAYKSGSSRNRSVLVCCGVVAPFRGRRGNPFPAECVESGLFRNADRASAYLASRAQVACDCDVVPMAPPAAPQGLTAVVMTSRQGDRGSAALCLQWEAVPQELSSWTNIAHANRRAESSDM